MSGKVRLSGKYKGSLRKGTILSEIREQTIEESIDTVGDQANINIMIGHDLLKDNLEAKKRTSLEKVMDFQKQIVA